MPTLPYQTSHMSDLLIRPYHIKDKHKFTDHVNLWRPVHPKIR